MAVNNQAVSETFLPCSRIYINVILGSSFEQAMMNFNEKYFQEIRLHEVGSIARQHIDTVNDVGLYLASIIRILQ